MVRTNYKLTMEFEKYKEVFDKSFSKVEPNTFVKNMQELEYTFINKSFSYWDSITLTRTTCISEVPNSWFCRVWFDGQFGQSYHKNKFTAYRLAVKDFEENKDTNIKKLEF